MGVGTASALPPGGAKESTPHTSSTVSSSVSEHGVISFSLSGFPANSVVSVKVDDGALCPSGAVQGACVVHQQKTDSNGKVTGSFVLPDVGPGTHTLRFLASREKRDKDGKYLGTEAYSNRSPEFTVVGEGGSDNSSSNSSGSSSNRGSSSSKSNGGSSNGGSNSADETQGSNDSNESSSNGGSNGSAGVAAEAETVYTDADGNTITKEEYDRLNAEAGSSATSTSSAAPAASASANAQKKATASASGAANTASTVQTVTYGAAFPWVGVVVLGVSVVAAAALLLTRKR